MNTPLFCCVDVKCGTTARCTTVQGREDGIATDTAVRSYINCNLHFKRSSCSFGSPNATLRYFPAPLLGSLT